MHTITRSDFGGGTSSSEPAIVRYKNFGLVLDQESDGIFDYAYDCANRLASVFSNGTVLVSNHYDAYSRRVRKVMPTAIHTFIYDGWNLVEERIAHTIGTSSTIKYHWGKDISGSLQGAGGVGGLLYLTIDGQIFVPYCDNNGNITKYLEASGSIVAAYAYDAFGKTISKSGALADFFRYRFSTKYYDVETRLYYYGYRFYHPALMRWLNRDPIEERGGLNVYGFCGNNPCAGFDNLGMAYFAVRRLSWMPGILRYSHLAGIIGIVPALILDMGLADRLNVEILHEHLFYNDGTNVGYGKNKEFAEESADGYQRRDHIEYDDCIMKEAQKRVPKPPYSLLGIGKCAKFNCQDYADSLRREYNRLLNDKRTRCKCREKKEN